MIYQEVSLFSTGAIPAGWTQPVYTISVDEKPRTQEIGLSAPDLSSVVDKHAAVGREYEHVRHSTVSVLAGIALHLGQIFANVEDRHRSLDFIAPLNDHYSTAATIRVVHDNDSAHISKETIIYLTSRQGRFEYVHTPKHGSWLKLIEYAFSKVS